MNTMYAKHISNHPYNKLQLTTNTGDYSNMFRLFLIAIFRKHSIQRIYMELKFDFVDSKW